MPKGNSCNQSTVERKSLQDHIIKTFLLSDEWEQGSESSSHIWKIKMN